MFQAFIATKPVLPSRKQGNNRICTIYMCVCVCVGGGGGGGGGVLTMAVIM